MLTPEQVTFWWPQLEPMFDASVKANPIADTEYIAEDIHMLVLGGVASIVAVFEDDIPAFALAFQFCDTNGKKGANIIAMGGRDMLRFKATYWEPFLTWLRSNDVEFIDAYVPTERLAIYERRLGFEKSCAFVRKLL
jgi:hypothetical protein